jgi:cytoskeletal protein RodZ
MESFGTYLRRERELRGVSLDQVAESTRIKRGHLEALEKDDHAHLPERPYLLGWVRSYANAVGLEPEDTALRFQEFLQAGEENRGRDPKNRGHDPDFANAHSSRRRPATVAKSGHVPGFSGHVPGFPPRWMLGLGVAAVLGAVLGLLL